MREYTSASGERRLWYEPAEIDQIMIDELEKASLLPDAGSDDVTVDLEWLVERHLQLPFDQHADLEAEILGITHFCAGMLPKIEINRDLTGAFDAEDATTGIKGRWRATVAHEIGHALLHRILYDLDDLQRGLFTSQTREQGGRAPQLMRCLKRDVGYTGGNDWREIQANKAIGALLMPKPVMLTVLEQECAHLGLSGLLERGSAELTELVNEVARRFTVSKQAAGIRVEGLGRVSPRGQAQL